MSTGTAGIPAGAEAAPEPSRGDGGAWRRFLEGPASPLESLAWAAFWAALLAVAVHLNTLGNSFAYDDVFILPSNPPLHSLRTLPGLMMEPYWPGEYGALLGLWRPATILAFGLQWASWGDTPALFHLVNVLVHAGATALVVALVGRLSTVRVALVAGLVFAVHPVHVEAVANLVGLAEVLSAVFFLAACVVHLDRRETRYGARRLAAVGLLYLAAFATKESAVTLPAILFLLDAARGRLAARDLPAYVRRTAPLWILMVGIAAAMLLLRYSVLGSVAHPMAPLGASLLENGDVPRIWTLAEVWAHYSRLLVFPLDLSADYTPSILPIAISWNPLATAGALLTLATLGLALWTWRGAPMAPGRTSRRIFGFGVVWFLVTISPVANVVFLAGVLLAERTLYLPSVGFVALLAWCLVRMAARRRTLALATGALVVVLMGARTWERNPTWKSSETVFQRLLRDSPQSGRSQWVLGDLFFNRGAVSESLTAYRLAVGLLGGHYQVMTEVGKKLMISGRHDAATRILTRAWRDHPSFKPAPRFLAISYFNEGRWAEAERTGRAVYAMDPSDALVAHIVAGSLAQRGDLDGALTWRRRTIQLGEGDHWEQWIALSGLYLARGDTARARAARDSALSHRGDTPAATVRGAFEPFRPAGEVLQDSTALQDARRPEGGPPLR